MRYLYLSLVFMMASVPAALSCPGQAGKVIFSDDFSDDSGGWDVDNHANYAKGAFQIKADEKSKGDSSLNVQFNATEGDYCVEAAFPSEPTDPANSDDVGIYVLSADYNNKYGFSISTSGTAWVTRTTNGATSYLMTATPVPSIKKEPGSVNALRVIVKDQKLTFYVNGEQVKVLRAPATGNANRFGFWGGTDQTAPEKERIFSFKSYKVTEAH